MPWYWSLGLGILAAIILGFVAVAALVGGAILAGGYLIYRVATLVQRFARGLGGNSGPAEDELVVRNQAAKQRNQASLEIIDVEAEELPDSSER